MFYGEWCVLCVVYSYFRSFKVVHSMKMSHKDSLFPGLSVYDQFSPVQYAHNVAVWQGLHRMLTLISCRSEAHPLCHDWWEERKWRRTQSGIGFWAGGIKFRRTDERKAAQGEEEDPTQICRHTLFSLNLKPKAAWKTLQYCNPLRLMSGIENKIF